MKFPTTLRAVPDATHESQPELFGDDGFSLSTIAEEDSSVAMEMLIGGYSLPIDAVIRELYINADESHRVAGTTSPVMITMPTEELPFFCVSDEGLGLSPEDMVGIYTRPAASTKRDDDLATGGLGIGAKAPFTVADRFSVHSIKDGVSASMTMARVKGRLQHRLQGVVDVDPSVPNGVTVLVPVDQAAILDWWRALSRVLFWWEEGRFEITNADQSPVKLPRWTKRLLGKKEPLPVEPSIVRGYRPELAQRNHVIDVLHESKVLMGQIAYSIPKDAIQSREPMLFVLPVGSVTVAPTREAIVDTAENNAVLRDLFYAWQEEQFAGLARRVSDPDTSYLELLRLEVDLQKNALQPHFNQWVRRTRKDVIDRGELPNDAYDMARDLRRTDMPSFMAHGGSVAQKWKIRELAHHMLNERVVFVDEAGLADQRRKILTAWAKSEMVKAVVVDREAFEKVRFARLWRIPGERFRASWHTPTSHDLVRPLARPEEIEWVDPLDIKVVRPKKSAAPAPTGESSVVVRRLMEKQYTGDVEVSVDEIVKEVHQDWHGWAIIDTQARLAELPRMLPGHFVTISTGQRPALLVRKRLGDRALTVAEFLERQTEIFNTVLTRKERRYLADQHMLTLAGVQQYFLYATAWIEEIEDDAVRSIAREIESVVKAHDARVNSRKQSARVERTSFLLRALRGVSWDEKWFIDNATLGKYTPAVFAAQSMGFEAWRADVASPSVVALIRNTIATQLV